MVPLICNGVLRLGGGGEAASRIQALKVLGFNIGAVMIRIGCRGILYYNYNKEPPSLLVVSIQQ